MTKRMVKYPSIDQLRKVIKAIQHTAHYMGKDEEGNAIYDSTRQKPVVKFTGTVKLHGTHADISYSPTGGIWFQSRENIITPEKDNAAFASWGSATKHIEAIKCIIDQIVATENVEFGENTVLSLAGEWAGCFSYETPVRLADGSTMHIGKIVKEKLDVEVLSYNFETCKLEPKKVNGWFNNGYKNNWLKVDIKQRRRGGKGNGFFITSNHLVFSNIGGEVKEVKAGDLKVGDIVYTYGDKATYMVKQFLLGSLAGDASVDNDNYNISLRHSEDSQKHYNDFIDKLLTGASSSSYATSGFGSRMRSFLVKSFPEMKKITADIHKSGTKELTEDYLKLLHPPALAVWYMDDGSVIQHPGEGRSYQCCLHTLGFSKKTNDTICEYFNSHGYYCYVVSRSGKYSKEMFEIKFTIDGAKAFLSTVAPYIIDGFSYKLPECFRNIPKVDWNAKLNEYDNGLIETTVTNVTEYSFPECDKYKCVGYDLSVEDNMNYFANNTLVHNSGIQKSVAIAELPKAFYLFGIKLSESSDDYKWLPIEGYSNPEIGFYNIMDFPHYELEIDFNCPERSQNKLAELTEAVEAECPVAKQLGVSGIGEGMVMHGDWNGERYFFKVKGKKHSVSKVKTLASVDTEKLDSIDSFIDYAVTEHRLNQAIQCVFPNGEEPDIKKLGEVIRWFANDIMKEENDTLVENGLAWKDVASKVNSAVRAMFTSLT